MNANRKNETVIIKKYANRRLYNTATSTYITLDDLYDMVKEGTEFQVHDAKTGEDLTRQVLTQIIFERENSGAANLLPINFLKQLIMFYDDSIQSFVPHYLDNTMQMFLKNQEQVKQYFDASGLPQNFTSHISKVGEYNPIEQMEEITRKNMDMFQQALETFFAFPSMERKNPSGKK